MPTYEYACRRCGHQFETQQSFSDPALTECAECGGELRKVFSPVGIAFKGSGFYKTDNRSGADGGSSPSSDKSDKSDAKSEKKSEKKSDAKSGSASSPSSGAQSGGDKSGSASTASSTSSS